jgi:hypothetical protein
MSRISPRLNSAVAFLLYVGVVAACADPQCPDGDTSYRNEDGGSQSVSAVEGDDASMAAEDEASSPDNISTDSTREAAPADDTSVDAGREAGDAGREARPPDEPNALDGDTALAAAVDAAAPVDADVASDVAVTDPGTVTCASQPCQNDSACTDEPSGFRCSCPEQFIGERCEARTCTTTFLRTADDLAKARSCAEIEGDLTVTSAGIGAITASDLPYLTKITGHFSISGLANNGVETPRLRALTLPKLREIGGSLAVALTGAGSVIDIRFPALTRVGGGVVFADTETRRLELPALRTVDGGFVLAGLKRLCTLEIGAIERISVELKLADIFNLPASALEPLRRAFSATPSAENRIGCCLAVDTKCPERFSMEDRDAFCGCSSP